VTAYTPPVKKQALKTLKNELYIWPLYNLDNSPCMSRWLHGIPLAKQANLGHH